MGEPRLRVASSSSRVMPDSCLQEKGEWRGRRAQRGLTECCVEATRPHIQDTALQKQSTRISQEVVTRRSLPCP